ncbi:MAG: hypothetical protein A2X23_00260 [Chloroflexi bacterium GWC2_73_18]|nr:MAG: hypothetical protein A2X23_00260 [Chloroflexi bacterium GWC2_73_18]
MPRRSPNEPSPPDYRRLKWIGVLAPIAFVWAFEFIRLEYVDPTFKMEIGHVLSGLVMAVAVLGFALVMFFFLERAQRHVVARNRELAAINEVGAAVQGPLSLEELLDRALGSTLETTGALEATIVIDVAGGGEPLVRSLVVDGGRGRQGAPTLEVSLEAGGAAIGRLRLVFPRDSDRSLPFSGRALASIGSQIAAAIQLSRLVADLRRREREAQALYRVALQISSQSALPELLDLIAKDARELLGCDRAVACVTDPQTGVLRTGAWTDRLALADDGSVCLVPHAADAPDRHAANPLCPLRLRGEHESWIAQPLRGTNGPLGELCVTRLDGRPFGDPEQALLAALADLASIAVSTARMRDTEEQWLILKERDRIAREMHDSLAQVLGVIHLRLRRLHGGAERDGLAAVRAELDELAEIADEAYRDVREAILGLRESISPAAGFLGTLGEYVGKFSRQSGIETRLVIDGAALPALSPASEVQLLRVVQEALTNVRKHAGASSAVVRVGAAGDGTSITVEDDGIGFDPSRIAEALERGFGTRAMRERVEQIGGTLQILSAPGQGTRVVARLPAEPGREGGRDRASTDETNGSAAPGGRAPVATVDAHPDPAGR